MEANINLLFKLKQEKNISQNQMAKEIGISKTHLSRILNGKRKIGKECSIKFLTYLKPDLFMALMKVSK